MEKQIPTVEVDIEGEKVLLYQWLSQEEEDKFNTILLGDFEVNEKQLKEMSTGKSEMKISMSKVAESNKFLMQSLVKSPTWEIINSWKPSKRASLLNQINEVRSKN